MEVLSAKDVALRAAQKESRIYFDIFHIIFQFSPKTEILAMMTTCHDLHEQGIKHLLALRIPLHKNNVASFIRFLLVDPSSRVPHFQKLHIIVPRSDVAITQMGARLRDVLGDNVHPPQIKEISIMNSERWLTFNPWFHHFCLSLLSLERLELRQVAAQAYRLLQAINARLVTARIAFDSRNLRGSRREVSSLLANSTTYLQELCYQGAHFNSHTTQFPALQTLEIPMCDIVDIEPLLLSFPNLRSLYTTNGSRGCRLSRHSHIRVANQAVQARHGRWMRLDRLSGSVDQIYILGITSPVGLLELESQMSPDILTYISALLADTNPSRLRLIVEPQCFSLTLLPEVLGHSTSLSHVYLMIDITRYGRRTSELIETLVEQVRLLPPLTHLVIRWSALAYVELDIFGDGSDLGDDRADLGHAIMDALPSLQFLGIEATNRAGYYCTRGGDQTHLGSLSEEAGAQVIRAEQMIWHP